MNCLRSNKSLLRDVNNRQFDQFCFVSIEVARWSVGCLFLLLVFHWMRSSHYRFHSEINGREEGGDTPGMLLGSRLENNDLKPCA